MDVDRMTVLARGVVMTVGQPGISPVQECRKAEVYSDRIGSKRRDAEDALPCGGGKVVQRWLMRFEVVGGTYSGEGVVGHDVFDVLDMRRFVIRLPGSGQKSEGQGKPEVGDDEYRNGLPRRENDPSAAARDKRRERFGMDALQLARPIHNANTSSPPTKRPVPPKCRTVAPRSGERGTRPYSPCGAQP